MKIEPVYEGVRVDYKIISEGLEIIIDRDEAIKFAKYIYYMENLGD